MTPQIEVVHYVASGAPIRMALDEQEAFATEWRASAGGGELCARALEDLDDFGIDLLFRIAWEPEAYLLVPGAIYDGNRFPVLPIGYPPMYPAAVPDLATPVVTDVPRLPQFHLLAGDASYPAIGIYLPNSRRVQAIFFPAESAGRACGLKVSEDGSELEVRIQLPGVRDRRYTMVRTETPSEDQGFKLKRGEEIHARIQTVMQAASSLDDLFLVMDRYRNAVEGSATALAIAPFSAAGRLVQDMNMKTRWREEPGFFETSDSDFGTPFQVGWTGGGITSFALLHSQDREARSRATRNIDFVVENLQGRSGFYCGGYRQTIENDGFGAEHAERWVMVRKSGDFLLFLIRHLLTLDRRGESGPPTWAASAYRCAEAFRRNSPAWGQFVDVDSGEVVIGGSAASGTALGGMALAAQYFKEPGFLRAAESAGTELRDRWLAKGWCTGGPGEILNAPDSESAFGLIEGFIGLWEATGTSEWLDAAASAALQAASWVVPYDFNFPEDSTFGRLGMQSRGSVIANVQNKHSAPGICTLSSLALLKLYRASGEERWLELAVEISRALPQYVSSAERPIPADDGRPLPSGWMNERVNLSDWEAPERGIGELFYGPCWPMASMLLTALEMPGIYIDAPRDRIAVADHIEAKWDGESLQLSNGTTAPSELRILFDSEPERSLGELWWMNTPTLRLEPGERRNLTCAELSELYDPKRYACRDADAESDLGPEVVDLSMSAPVTV